MWWEEEEEDEEEEHEEEEEEKEEDRWCGAEERSWRKGGKAKENDMDGTR